MREITGSFSKQFRTLQTESLAMTEVISFGPRDCASDRPTAFAEANVEK